MEVQLRGLVLQLEGRGFQVEDHATKNKNKYMNPLSLWQPLVHPKVQESYQK